MAGALNSLVSRSRCSVEEEALRRMNNTPSCPTVLLVEDSAEILDLAELALARAGFVVLRASCQDEALAIWKELRQTIDLLITDVRLGESASGLDLAEHFLSLNPSLRVLAMSGLVSGEHLASLSSNIAFLEKPFAFEEIAARAQELLENRAVCG
jgi:DNA-binding response OmpR family regulator